MSTKQKTTEDKYVIIQGRDDQQIIAKVVGTNNRQKTTQVEHDDGRKQWLPNSLLTPVVQPASAVADDGDNTVYDKAATFAYLTEKMNRDFTERMYWYANQQERLIPDGHVGDSPYYYRRTLDAFLVKWRASGITIKEAAGKYDVAVSAVRHHLREQNIDFIGKRGHARVYDPDDMEALFQKA